MREVQRLETYHFYEKEWRSYDQLCDSFDWEIPDTFNMAEYVCDRWAGDKSRVALFSENENGDEQVFTFWQLHNLTNKLANYLTVQGIKPGDRIGINAPQKPATAIAHIAAWKIGAVSVPLSTLFGPDALSYRLNDADARVCFVDKQNIDAFRDVKGDIDSLENTLVIGDAELEGGEEDFWSAIEDSSRNFDVHQTDPEDNAIMLYTSGTTGNPKGVLHAHRVLLGHLPTFVTSWCNMEITDADIHWTPSEWAWMASLFDVLFPAFFYGKPVLAFNGGEFNAEQAFALIEKYGITNFFAPPTALRMMTQVSQPSERYDINSVRVIPSGGESLGESIVDWAQEVFSGAAVHEAYGQTEANLLIGDCTALTDSQEGKLGRKAPGHEVAIVNPDMAKPIVETGDIGEIAVKYENDPVCFKEYWNKPEKTEEKIQNGWLLTEDLGSCNKDGYFSFHSRKDDVLISGGYRIGPEEIEEALTSNDAVANAGVIGIPDDERGEVPKAFVVLTDDKIDLDQLRNELQQYVKEKLAMYKYPREIEFVDELPMTTTGKIRRKTLREWEGI